MSEHYEFFEQLRRGEDRSSESLHRQLHRIPPEADEGAVQVRRLLRHAEDEIFELAETIGNILRWHGRDEILFALTAEQRALWLKLKEISPMTGIEE